MEEDDYYISKKVGPVQCLQKPMSYGGGLKADSLTEPRLTIHYTTKPQTSRSILGDFIIFSQTEIIWSWRLCTYIKGTTYKNRLH